MARKRDPDIHIIGLGVAETAQLSEAALQALQCSAVIIGSERQLQIVQPVLQANNIQADRQVLPRLSMLSELLSQFEDKSISVLATGDPLYYGIGRWFAQRYPLQQLSYYPAISSIQAACHALGLSLQDVQVLSLHGRPIEKIRSQIKQQQTLLILTDQFSHPQALAQECKALGLEQSSVWVCENLGYAQQRVRQFSVAELLSDQSLNFDSLHVTIIKTQGWTDQVPAFPGIPDRQFLTGSAPGSGMITKREVRLAVLSLLQPGNEDVIWDIGAGCGGVSVEMAYWNERVSVHAIEHNVERLQFLAANIKQFGVLSNVHIFKARAPEIFASLPSANKVFIGGSDGALDTILLQCWQQLPENGLLVATAVTVKSKQKLIEFAGSLNADQIEIVEIGVNKGTIEQGQLVYKSKLPVTLFKFIK